MLVVGEATLLQVYYITDFSGSKLVAMAFLEKIVAVLAAEWQRRRVRGWTMYQWRS